MRSRDQPREASSSDRLRAVRLSKDRLRAANTSKGLCRAARLSSILHRAVKLSRDQLRVVSLSRDQVRVVSLSSDRLRAARLSRDLSQGKPRDNITALKLLIKNRREARHSSGRLRPLRDSKDLPPVDRVSSVRPKDHRQDIRKEGSRADPLRIDRLPPEGLRNGETFRDRLNQRHSMKRTRNPI